MNRRIRRKKRMARLGILAALAVAVLAVCFLFRVKTVHVYGNSRYTAEEISEALMYDLLNQNTLYLQWRYRSGVAPEALPFLSSLSVKLESPFTIRVDVVEKKLVGYVDKGGYAGFDQEGIVVEIAQEEYTDLPIITGADIGDPALYQRLPTESSAQLRTILSVTKLLNGQELDADEIRFGENGDIRVFVDGVEALLGQDEYMEEKIANLRAILQTSDGTRGTLHLESYSGKGDMTTLTPADETETESEPESRDTGGAGTDGSGEDGAGMDGSGQDGAGTDGSGQDGAGADGNGQDGADGNGQEDGPDDGGDDAQQDPSGVIYVVFATGGNLVYNVHVENGTVVDANGNPVSGCYVNEDGNVVDAYMNVINPVTGELVNQ